MPRSAWHHWLRSSTQRRAAAGPGPESARELLCAKPGGQQGASGLLPGPISRAIRATFAGCGRQSLVSPGFAAKRGAATKRLSPPCWQCAHAAADRSSRTLPSQSLVQGPPSACGCGSELAGATACLAQRHLPSARCRPARETRPEPLAQRRPRCAAPRTARTQRLAKTTSCSWRTAWPWEPKSGWPCWW